MSAKIKRREFITLLGGAGAAWPLAARAQQGERMRRVGVVMGYAETDPAAQAQVAALRQELQKLGWDESRNILIDVRFPGTDAGRARAILMELISLTPDVLVSNTNLVTEVVQAEVRTLPIVFYKRRRSCRFGFCQQRGPSQLQPHGVRKLGHVDERKMAGAAQGGRAPGRTRRAHGLSRDGRQYWVLQFCSSPGPCTQG